MPITALDILPARTEVSSLSGSDSGYKAQGTSAGKNDGLSFSEMLERAGQKDTTDGKVNTGENASDKTPASDAKPVEEAREVSKEDRETQVSENQKNQVEQKNSDETAENEGELSSRMAVSENSADDLENVLLASKNDLASEMTAETVPSEDAASSAKLLAKQNVAAENELVPQELPEITVSNDKTEYVASVMEAVKNAEQSAKATAKETVDAETVADARTADTLSSESSDVKKEKKSRFSEYDTLVAMLAKPGDKEAPAAMQEVLPADAQDMAALVAKNDAALPVSEKIQVVDMRSESEHFEKHVTFDDKGNAEVSLSLIPNDSAVSTKDGVELGAEGLTKADFASMLSKELETSAGDIVKTGSIVLQNNGKGSINLILHPEQLGNVKIKLELSDNQVSGKIVVASREAYEAFKENISAIKEAFSASGFETGGFELAWGGSGNGGDQSQQEGKQLAQEQSLNRNGTTYVDSMPDVLPEEYAGSGTVNLVA